MARVRKGEYKALYELPVKADYCAIPKLGEPVERCLSRLKRWAAKIPDRSFRFRVDDYGDAVWVQRTPHGMNGRLADWQMMPFATRLLLKTAPQANHIRRAEAAAYYLSWIKGDRQRARGTKRYDHLGLWTTYIDGKGRLLACCIGDTAGNTVDDFPFEKWPVEELWGGEWA